MGREVHQPSDDVEFENYHPGCMRGIFNVLDNHHWYNVKKMLPHRKFNRGRRSRWCANPRTLSMEREPVESQRLLDAEAEQIQVQQQTRQTGSTNKRSGNAPTKGLTSKEKAKEENDNKDWILVHSAKSQLQQTDSTHHLEPSGFDLGWMNPIILVRKLGNTSDTTSTKSKKPNIRSFSMPDSPRSDYLRSSTLEHKQKEVWSFRRGEKFIAGAQLSKSKALTRTDDHFRSIIKEEASSSFQASDSQRWNHLVMNRLKDIKQRIKQSLKDRRKSINHTRANDCPPNNADDHDIDNGRLRMMIRTKSINELLDRYTRLFHHNKETDAHIEPKPASFPEDIDEVELVEAVIEAELQENTREGLYSRGLTSLSVDKSSEQIAKPCEFNEDAVELTQPTSELSDITSTAKLPLSEGLGPNHSNFPEGEAEYFTKERPRTSQESVDNKTMGNSSRFLFFEPDREADPWYNYVKDILELLGFTRDEGRQIWFSPDQPLDPSMFKEMETLLHPELEFTIDEVGSNCDHQLVFDLVDEELL
ncbi:Fasciclin-like arabinogalactan family protein [Hibiscus syriacus]|uniref:Fasciclin-like arabinogalactan family protein n=1 Tax=Hibiscus syriacus TaxID=106335 RepID=A0A6A2WXK9_HIBSY|nr:Fasciclin-like arabinogalactan family protein [Hibiscus syriacus]